MVEQKLAAIGGEFGGSHGTGLDGVEKCANARNGCRQYTQRFVADGGAEAVPSVDQGFGDTLGAKLGQRADCRELDARRDCWLQQVAEAGQGVCFVGESECSRCRDSQ